MTPRMKILKHDDLYQWARTGDSVVMTNGCFDILHYGHIRHLVQAATSGKRLLVAVDSDERVRMLKGESRPINPIDHRLYSLAALECVSGVVEFDDLPFMIRVVRPAIYTKSGYAIEDFNPAEREALSDVGAEIRLIPLEPNVSTTLTLSRLHEHPPISH